MVGEVIVPPSRKLEDLIRLAELCVDLLRQNEEFYAEVNIQILKQTSSIQKNKCCIYLLGIFFAQARNNPRRNYYVETYLLYRCILYVIISFETTEICILFPQMFNNSSQIGSKLAQKTVYCKKYHFMYSNYLVPFCICFVFQFQNVSCFKKYTINVLNVFFFCFLPLMLSIVQIRIR